VTAGAAILFIALMSGWVISLAWSEIAAQTQLAEIRGAAVIGSEGSNLKNSVTIGQLGTGLAKLEKEGATLNRITEKASQGEIRNESEFQAFRKDLLREAITFWDRALEIDKGLYGDRGPNAAFCRRQRALCIARLGKHEEASEVAKHLSIGPPGEPAGEADYDLAKVYSQCASGAKDNRPLADDYADRAMRHLHKATAVGFFKEPANMERLRKDPDLASLGTREDFAKLLNEVKTEPK